MIKLNLLVAALVSSALLLFCLVAAYADKKDRSENAQDMKEKPMDKKENK